MARNKNKYEYIELAILRDSPLLQALLADVAASGKPAAQVAVQRLADYYRAGSRPAPAQTNLITQVQQPGTPPAAAFVSEQETSTNISPMVEQPEVAASDDEEMEYQAEQARANALAALDALGTWN